MRSLLQRRLPIICRPAQTRTFYADDFYIEDTPCSVVFNLKSTRSIELAKKIMTLHAILVINKAGGLIYNKDLANGISKLTSNEYLVLAGTLHGIHAITSQISPVSNSTGLEFLQAGNLSFYCFQTPTGN
jgi:hypothetical protein